MSKHAVRELIKNLGGDVKVAEMIGVDQPMVTFWKARGWVGLDYVLRLANLGKIDPLDLLYERLATPKIKNGKPENEDEQEET